VQRTNTEKITNFQGINYVRSKGVVRPSECYVNHTYARKLKPTQVTYLMNNFDTQRLDLPLVCEVEKDKYEIINGQHRFHVIGIKLGMNELVEVQVLPYMPIKERSALYSAYNLGSKPLTFDEKFKARIVSEDPIAVAVDKVCKRIGIKIAGITAHKGSGARRFPICRSAKLLEQLFNRGSLERTLTILSDAYKETDPDYSKDALSHNLVRSIGKIVYHYRHDIDEERLISILRNKPAWTWTALTSVVGISGMFKESYGAITIMETYNKNLTVNRLDESRLTDRTEPKYSTEKHTDYMEGVNKG